MTLKLVDKFGQDVGQLLWPAQCIPRAGDRIQRMRGLAELVVREVLWKDRGALMEPTVVLVVEESV